jgi:uncharacterized protein (TIGR02001 family)
MPLNRFGARLLLAACAYAASLYAAGSAWAQWNASATLVSDYRFRGVSLSDEKPAPQLTVAYDSPAGWYAGAFAAPVKLGPYLESSTQLIAYGGYAGRLSHSLSWDAGLNTSTYQGNSEYNYTEAYAGLAMPNASIKLYLAPHYFGQDMRTGYLELDGFYPLHSISDKLNLVGHVGWLHRFSPSAYYGLPATRADARLGLSAALQAWNLQLSWVAVQHQYNGYLYGPKQSTSTAVLSVSRTF